MVFTSSTQWTIPLSASSPSLARQGSVLGLKTCQLSAPQQYAVNGTSTELHHQDLHSTSSRRLQGTEQAPSRRSAGSFRQLEDFCTKLAHEVVTPPCPASPDWVCNQQFECKYDGIAIPWSSSPLHTLIDDATRICDIAPNFKKNFIDADGDITADDVDLLPMTGLLSYPSSFVTHQRSNKDPKSVDISSPESSGNSSKSSVMVPNYLGLPPEFNEESTIENMVGDFNAGLADHMCRESAPLTPPVSVEHSRGGGNHLSCADHAAFGGKNADNFVASLAGLCSNACINDDTDYMLHDLESLASIFNVYPQNFHGFSLSGQRGIDTCNDESAQLVMDDLRYLMNGSTDDCEGKDKGSDALHGEAIVSVNENGRDIVLEASRSRTHGQSCNVVSQSNASTPKGSVKASSAMSSGSSLSHARTKMESVSPLKRPFSVLDFSGMAPLGTSTSACVSGSNAWRLQLNGMGLPVHAKGHEDPASSFSSSLYKSRKDHKLADGGLSYHLPAVHGGHVLDEEMMPRPPPTKVRRKHGTAMDPQSVAARTRREKFSDRIRILQSLVPNGERLDTVSMLGQTLEYVRFLQHQVWQLYHGKDPASSMNNTCEKWKDFVETAVLQTVPLASTIQH